MGEYYNWVMQYKVRGDPVGDLVTDIKDDEKFPQDIDDKEELLAYLNSRGACPGAIAAFDTSWQRFKASARRRK